jgi:leucyl aminopeptidase
MAPLWIRDLWLGYAAGRPDVTVELYFHSGTIQPSVILTIEGGELADEVVVLGAHLDSISFNGGNSGSRDYLAPGADDDASGIIVLSEVIRVAMAKNFRPKRTVQFMGYAAEEVGLIGSDEIAAAYQAAGINVVAVQQLDMTAYFGSVEDIGVLSEQWTDPELTTFVTDLIDFYQPELQWVFTACGYGCSDHRSWYVRAYPAAMAFESRFGQHNPAIHTIDDTLATLGHSVDHAYKFARLAVAFMVEIAKESNLDIFADGFESGDTSAWSLVVP